MTPPPRISVLMPVYNAGAYLQEALGSVLAQTLTDHEVVLIDDGSTDGSGELMREYAERDARIRVISRENRGLIASLNEGLEATRGTYVARMDADDICLPERFERQAAHLDSHAECVAVGCRVLLIDPEAAPLKPFAQKLTHAEIDAAHMAGRGGAICHPAAMFRRDVLVRIGGYRPSMRHAEDLDLFLRLAELGELANLPDILLHYRMHPESIGHRYRREQQRNTIAAVGEAHARRKLPPPEQIHFRPPRGSATLHRKWAWWALTAGYLRTARKHALRSLLAEPLSRHSWKTLACALRGH